MPLALVEREFELKQQRISHEKVIENFESKNGRPMKNKEKKIEFCIF